MSFRLTRYETLVLNEMHDVSTDAETIRNQLQQKGIEDRPSEIGRVFRSLERKGLVTYDKTTSMKRKSRNGKNHPIQVMWFRPTMLGFAHMKHDK